MAIVPSLIGVVFAIVPRICISCLSSLIVLDRSRRRTGLHSISEIMVLAISSWASSLERF